MPESYRPYPPEFRRRMVESVRGGREPEASAREFEPTAQSIHNRVTG
jgi:transposase-like protein